MNKNRSAVTGLQSQSKTDGARNASAFSASPAYANYVLGVLFVVYVFNFIDRQVLSVFIGPIKAEFGASDTAMGLLAGFAFALLYTIGGIPIARWADRGSRRTIISIGLALWSVMTVFTGLARNFSQLILARVGVGIGEAACTPPAHSLISDYFPFDRRATALGIYSSGIFVGAGLAFLSGGYLREYFDWRTAFLLVGAPGLLFALVVRLTVREPPRGYSEQHTGDMSVAALGETLSFLLGSKSWLYLIAGASLLAVNGYGVLMWGYEFYGRVHGMDAIAIGKWMAFIVGVAGALGSLIGGRLTDRMAAGKISRALSVPALATMAGFPLSLLFLLVDSSRLSLLCFLPCYLLLNVYIPAMYSANQSLVKLNMRATATAVLLFIVNIVGAGAGPFIVGALSDYFADSVGALSIRYALATISVATVMGCGLLLLSARFLERDMQRVGTRA